MSEPLWCPIARKFCRCDWRCEDEAAIRDYVDAMLRRDVLARHEGRPEHDLDTCGRPLKR